MRAQPWKQDCRSRLSGCSTCLPARAVMAGLRVPRCPPHLKAASYTHTQEMPCIRRGPPHGRLHWVFYAAPYRRDSAEADLVALTGHFAALRSRLHLPSRGVGVGAYASSALDPGGPTGEARGKGPSNSSSFGITPVRCPGLTFKGKMQEPCPPNDGTSHDAATPSRQALVNPESASGHRTGPVAPQVY